MAIVKRGEIWHIQFTAPDGRRIRESAKTTDRDKAQQFHDELKAKLWNQVIRGEKPTYAWQDAVVRWCTLHSDKKSFAKDLEIFNWLDPFLKGMPLQDMDHDFLLGILTQKASESSRSTANRYMALVRAVLRKSYGTWKLIDQLPDVPMFPKAKDRHRYLTRDEAKRLLKELLPHQRKMVRFCLLMGLRSQAITQLKWADVDFQRKLVNVRLKSAKHDHSYKAPLNSQAIALLESCLGDHPEYVFTYRGKPVKKVNTKSWRKALLRAGIHDFKFHDLRHTWASWHVMEGTSLQELKELGGWQTFKSVLVYAHLSDDHLHGKAENVSFDLTE